MSTCCAARRTSSGKQTLTMWTTPQQHITWMIKRLNKAGRLTNAIVPAANDSRSAHPAHVFVIRYDGELLHVALIPGLNTFTKAHDVECGDWKDFEPELTTLTEQPAFRTAFEWFVKTGEIGTTNPSDIDLDGLHWHAGHFSAWSGQSRGRPAVPVARTESDLTWAAIAGNPNGAGRFNPQALR